MITLKVAHLNEDGEPTTGVAFDADHKGRIIKIDWSALDEMCGRRHWILGVSYD